MKGRLAVVGAGLVAILVLAALASGDHRRAADASALRISLVSSPEKADLVRTLVGRFNSERPLQVGGRTVRVDLQIANSGDAESSIQSGGLRPVMWSPASSLWGRLLNTEARRQLVPNTNPSLVRTPLVIAMWEPMARALGWPESPISLRKVLDLATAGSGWAAYGHPEFGPFKLGHTDPDVSTSGLSAVVAEYYAEAGQPATLGARQLHDPRLQGAIRAIEQSVVHYGDTTLSFAQQLKRYGPAYASAVAMEETTLVAINQAHPNPRLVAIYPADGTFFSDSPLIVLDAPWVSASERLAARAVARWLVDHVTPQLAARYGFRTKPGARVLPPLDGANGVDPREPTRQLPFPPGGVVKSIRDDWRLNRKPANVMLVVDTSDEMSGGGKLDSAKRALGVFLNALASTDRAGLISFSDRVSASSFGPLNTGQRAFLREAVNELTAGGDNVQYDATDVALHKLEHLRSSGRINAVVLLAAGGDNRSTAVNEPQLAAQLRAQATRTGVSVYTIAYGEDANPQALGALADASEGYAFSANPSSIDSVLRTIASYL